MVVEPPEPRFPASLADLIERAGKTAPERAVQRWNPDVCGQIDIRIDAAGTWYYRGSAIGREALVRLFASILRREADGGHVLVTPAEKLAIQVEDAPFIAVEMTGEGEGANQQLTFRTNVGDLVPVGRNHPLRFAVEAEHDGLKPYIGVRGGLEALVTRALTYDLVALADEPQARTGEAGTDRAGTGRGGTDGDGPGIWSGGSFFALPVGKTA